MWTSVNTRPERSAGAVTRPVPRIPACKSVPPPPPFLPPTMSCRLFAFHRNTLALSHTVANLCGFLGWKAMAYTSSVWPWTSTSGIWGGGGGCRVHAHADGARGTGLTFRSGCPDPTLVFFTRSPDPTCPSLLYPPRQLVSPPLCCPRSTPHLLCDLPDLASVGSRHNVVAARPRVQGAEGAGGGLPHLLELRGGGRGEGESGQRGGRKGSDKKYTCIHTFILPLSPPTPRSS